MDINSDVRRSDNRHTAVTVTQGTRTRRIGFGSQGSGNNAVIILFITVFRSTEDDVQPFTADNRINLTLYVQVKVSFKLYRTSCPKTTVFG